ncbi:hypothetical protein [Paracoccus rhizosphaerae]|uniref:Uncharacterized protein n=1 Tax=Paracoccus rhizosphaerae TaxID=1133347 RepID=A0ABV6CH28_9RHOB|nr:hypothetical protein [Paracoccus rhizosphaerae]
MRCAERIYFTFTLRLLEPPADAVTVGYLARSEDGFIYDGLVA